MQVWIESCTNYLGESTKKIYSIHRCVSQGAFDCVQRVPYRTCNGMHEGDQTERVCEYAAGRCNLVSAIIECVGGWESVLHIVAVTTKDAVRYLVFYVGGP